MFSHARDGRARLSKFAAYASGEAFLMSIHARDAFAGKLTQFPARERKFAKMMISAKVDFRPKSAKFSSIFRARNFKAYASRDSFPVCMHARMPRLSFPLTGRERCLFVPRPPAPSAFDKPDRSPIQP